MINVITISLSILAATGTYHFFKKEHAIGQAIKMCDSKGMINFGSGYLRNGFSTAVANLPEVAINVDKNVPDNDERYLSWNLEEPLPFSDRQFSVAFSSHVLEHLDNWQQAMDEWNRVADKVVVVLPNPVSITGLLHPDHKQHFSFNDVENMRVMWPRTTIVI